MFVKQKNAKHQKSNGTIWTFSLPAIKTCPGAGACKAYCYAKRFARYPSVGIAYARNMALTKSNTFINTAVSEIKKGMPAYVRWHVSGDVYSQDYLDKLTAIAKACPDTKFYLYTKSVYLNWSKFKALRNTRAVFSLGGCFDALIKKTDIHAKVFIKKADLKREGYVDVSNDDLLVWTSTKLGIVKH